MAEQVRKEKKDAPLSEALLSDTDLLSAKLENLSADAKKRAHDNCADLDEAKRVKLEAGSKTASLPATPTFSSSFLPTAAQATTPTYPPALSLAIPSYPPTATATPPPSFTKPSWVDKMPALILNAEQKAALEKAKAFARDMQAALLKAAGKNNSPPPIPSILLSSNPGLASGIDPRSLSVLSRIYVGSINFELTEEHLRGVFGQFGAIKSVSMSLDPITGKHKGFCFIEFETPEGASLALDSMNGAGLGGRQLKVGRPNNYTAATAAGLLPPPKTRIYVSNVNQFVSEENLLSIFESFGKIIQCVLMPDLMTRKHKGYGQ